MKYGDTNILKVHVMRGRVWYAAGATQTRFSKQTVDEFLESPILRSAEYVRLAGSLSNARLITLLFDLKKQGQLAHVEVATPLVCATRRDRLTRPEEMIKQLRLCRLPPSLGGFHEVVEADYYAYALAEEVRANKAAGHTSNNNQILDLLYMHPAWGPLSFIRQLSKPHVAELLGLIIDPRWYIDPAHPNRRSKLEAATGLTPYNQAGVTLPKHKHGWHHEQCLLVLSCWKDDAYHDEVVKRLEIMGPTPIHGSDQPGLTPCDFVWRTWGRFMCLGVDCEEKSPDPVRADLRASQHFLRFLHNTWLSELYRHSPMLPDRCTALFRPSDLFKHEAEITAYEMHQIAHGLL